MKKVIFPLIIIYIFVITTNLSCSNKPKRSRKPVSTITVLPEAKNYIFDNNVSVRIKTKCKNGSIDNIRFYYNGKLLKISKNLEFTVNDISLNQIGINTFYVVATKKDSVSNTRTKNINVISNVKPKKYTYTTIKDYPHNKKFYTQGLEIHDGYIYEGTGENGASGIFKINLSNGKILQQHLLHKKYFGEGITIFNDKIYQLTYHSQKGFVYNLNDFALIDSFQYKSKEGWGLTNDGKYLIMSNGTNELIWLDPNNYSEVKKIQVANDRGIINYLNELEYINNTIYANIYTTDLIVQIDPKTGKVLSEINLKGIVNMYINSTDTIDYLNGIAYDPVNNRFFVTGKWWPRLFEIELIKSK